MDKIVLTKEIVASITGAIYDRMKEMDFEMEGYKEFYIELNDDDLKFYANIHCQGHTASFHHYPRCWEHDEEIGGTIVAELLDIEFFDYYDGNAIGYEISEELNKELFAEVEYEWGY